MQPDRESVNVVGDDEAFADDVRIRNRWRDNAPSRRLYGQMVS